MVAVISGALIMGYIVAGLFFMRFWRDTRDRLFAIFAWAFWLLAVQRTVLVFMRFDSEADTTWTYALRLLAFLLFLYAIVDKNRATVSSPR